MKKVKIIDYAGNTTEVEIDLDDILSIELSVFSGDEILTIVHKDGSIDHEDSSWTRNTWYYDGSYMIYQLSAGINLLDDEQFVNRTTSYSYMWGDHP